MTVKCLPEERAVLKHKLMSRIDDGAIAMKELELTDVLTVTK